MKDTDALDTILRYHAQTKHHPDRYAPSLGYMDWENQPVPFRWFNNTEKIDLFHPDIRQTPGYDALFGSIPDPAPLDAVFISALFYHSLALAAWKQASGSRPWSLRINPSSGALYPTESYLISPGIQGLYDTGGLFHYDPMHHRLERRCRIPDPAWADLSSHVNSSFLILGLSSIFWRESWKYGARALRYCHLDVGHAIGCISFAARALGWKLSMLTHLSHEDMNHILGTGAMAHTTGDDHHKRSQMKLEHPEQEVPDALLLLTPDQRDAESGLPKPTHGPDEGLCRALKARFSGLTFEGAPNRLSREHHEWPLIDDAALALARTESTPTFPDKDPANAPIGWPGHFDRPDPSGVIFRKRRSVSTMDPEGILALDTFYTMLARTLPEQFMFDALVLPAQVSLVLFVHRVESLLPGLYILIRNRPGSEHLIKTLKTTYTLEPEPNCPEALEFYRLCARSQAEQPADVPDQWRDSILIDTSNPETIQDLASRISCHQDIAGLGAFSLGMIARFEPLLQSMGPLAYPMLFWECGLIGQVLYLEATAAGFAGTGIGCFFDDMMHRLLGIHTISFQSLYHFTVGRPIIDSRLKSLAPYHHLGR
ncbi:MAG: SagB/ThcOx family dehydrogenase [Desulfobacteraceae bacterium]|nr:MAG: SagB/ThcOx family dehydrogenase [Desulfobacteraceae bacterium]